jgi:hypothetical protein
MDQLYQFISEAFLTFIAQIEFFSSVNVAKCVRGRCGGESTRPAALANVKRLLEDANKRERDLAAGIHIKSKR